MTEVGKLPFWCRIRRHGWRPRAFWPGYERRRWCKRCDHILPYQGGVRTDSDKPAGMFAVGISETGCRGTWEFDVDFFARCQLQPKHLGDHYAVIQGNGDIVAQIRWDD